ncbi:MAG: ABC transporter ATP-binding protein [Sporomusa sp.]
MNESVLTIRDVTYRYDSCDKNSLTGISLAVHPGECVVLTGTSGCGKTTLTRIANGLIPHFYEGTMEGDAQVSGHEITDTPPHVLSPLIGSVFQNPRSQFFNTDTDSEIVFGMENAGLPRQEMQCRYTATVKQLDIGHLSGRSVYELSGGQKQIVACAGVYAMEPALLVLDEPSSNLDDAAIEHLRDFLQLAKCQGKAILIAEHRLHYLREVADRVLLLNDGRITEDWPAGQITNASNAQLAALGLRSFHHVPLNRPIAKSNASPVDALRADGLWAGYKKQQYVLCGASFSLTAGEITGLMGKNGEGKTTLARVLCGLHKQTKGTVQMDGKNLSARQRQRAVALVMQDAGHQLFSDSVENELRLWGQKKHIPNNGKITSVLEQLQLSGFEEYHPMSLSGGQKQRLCIALAALSPATVLLFDEPTSGLDYTNMQKVAAMLRMLAGLDKAILVVSHDHEFLNTVCDRFLCLEDGKIRTEPNK